MEIEYYLVHNYLDSNHMLAYVRNISIDHYGLKYFQDYDSYNFINVQYINRCIGFAKINDRIYIFDKQNQVFYE